MPSDPTRMPPVAKAFLVGLIVFGAVIILIGKSTSAVTPTAGSEFQIEGFQKAKIIGISNGRAIVVLTNNAGQNSYEEMSFNTVEMLKSLPEEK